MTSGDSRTPGPSTPPAAPSANPTAVPAGASVQAPWRLEYLESVDAAEKAAKPAPTAAGAPASSGSFLLDYWRSSNPAIDDLAHHVIVRATHGLILLNAFPYTSGHVLAALGEARPTLTDYDALQRRRLWELVDLAMELVTRTLSPQGVNVGVNQGRAAGAGVPQHLHVHLVPRWSGDVNFISVVGQVRIIPASLEKMGERYRQTWQAMGGVEGWEKLSGVRV